MRRRASNLALAAVLYFGVVGFSVSALAQDKPATEPAKQESAANAGEADFNAAIDARIDADGLDSLQKVIDLLKSALSKGLPEGDVESAKEMLAATAFQKAELLKAQLGETQLNAQGKLRVLNEIENSVKIALENDPKLYEAHALMGALQFAKEKRGDARDSMSKAIELAEAADEAPAEISKLYLQRGVMQADSEDGKKDISKALELDNKNVDAWQAKVDLALIKNDEEGAFEALQGFLNSSSDNVNAMEKAIAAMLGLKKDDAALAALNEKIPKFPESANLLKLRAQAKSNLKDFDGAVADFTSAIDIAPQDVAAYLLRAQLYIRMDKMDLASEDVDRVFALQPGGNPFALRLRAIISADQKKFSEAIADLELIVRNNPGDLDYLRQLAQTYLLDDRPSLAIKTCTEILKAEPKDVVTLRLRGDAYLSVGQQKEAIEDFETALKHIPEDDTILDRSGLLNNLSWVLATSPKDEIRNGDRSLELALKACELTEYKKAHILSTLAAAYAEKGDFEKAREWSAKAVEAGKADSADQLEQLEQELKSYEENKPWRELQETEESAKPNVQLEQGVDA